VSVEMRWPERLEDAQALLADEDAHALAGGQSLVLLMNTGLARPRVLVCLDRLRELRGRSIGDEVADIGAACTHHELARDLQLTARIPALGDMFRGVGNIRVRANGTLGGNLAHCDPAPDPPVLLAALGATAVVHGPEGEREVAVEDLALGPLVPALAEDELIVRIRVPLRDEATSSYVKFLPGTQDDYATVSVGVCLIRDADGLVTEARLVAGAVGPTARPLRAADALVGYDARDEDVLAHVAALVEEEVSPTADRRGSVEYKRAMAGEVCRRALRRCTTEAGT
jgi:aerobic carbon-monoxide dehydrogenase medium subunit